MYTAHRFAGLGEVPTAGSFAPGTLPTISAKLGSRVDARRITANSTSRAVQQIQAAAGPISSLSTTARETLATTDALRRPGPSGDALAGTKCECYVDAVKKHAEKQGTAVDAASLAQLSFACASDEAGFVEAMKQGSVNYEACKPIYMRKSTWLIGGLVLVGALVVLR